MKQYKDDVEAIAGFLEKYQEIKKEIAKVIVGQDQVVENVLIPIFSRGHGLLIGVPGLAKTLLISTISEVMGLSFSRIQFTPDLMPSDIVGSEILDEHKSFKYIQGPVFANILLADEINRTPPKTQSALLEAMQERIVTVAGKPYPLPDPFFVLSTQNPIEQEGTYPLPEAQLDRFMFNIILDYPSFQEEVDIVKSTTSPGQQKPGIVVSREEILYYQELIRRIPVADNLYEYAVRLASKTRPGTAAAHDWANLYLNWGAGPRASQFLIIGAKCHAAIHGKYSPDIENINAVADIVLRHRIVRNFKAEAEGVSVEDIIGKFISSK
ncbi:MAG: MoxR family ATPase [Bacteroidales bacterium]|nr:MoxR family ATPase [Bacteroidales bacterium]